MDFISGPIGMALQEDWEQADRQLRMEAAASRARRPAPAKPTQKESKPMGTKITLTPEMRKRLGLSDNPTGAEMVEAVQAINRRLDARNASNRAKLAAADVSGAVTGDAIYEELWPTAKAPASDPTEGLSAADAAIYRELWPEG